MNDISEFAFYASAHAYSFNFNRHKIKVSSQNWIWLKKKSWKAHKIAPRHVHQIEQKKIAIVLNFDIKND